MLLGLLIGFALGRMTGETRAIDPARLAVHADPVPRRATATASRRRVAAVGGDRRDHAAAPTATKPRVERPAAPDQTSTRARPAAVPYSDWTPEQFLAAFRDAAAGPGHFPLKALAIAKNKFQPNLRIPLGVILGIVHRGDWLPNRGFVRNFTDTEVDTVLRNAESATLDDLASWFLAKWAAEQAAARSATISAGRIDALLDHEWYRIREVGVILVARTKNADLVRVREMALNDPNRTLRVIALRNLVAAETRDGGVTAATLGVLRAALDSGSAHVRAITADLLPDAGPAAGPIALEFLSRSGFDPEPALAWGLYATVVRSGLAPRVLDASSSEATRSWIANSLKSADDLPQLLVTLRPRLVNLAAALSLEELASFYEILAKNGQSALVGEAATNRGFAQRRRLVAFEALREAADDDQRLEPALIEVATRVVWDDTLSAESRADALELIAAEESYRMTAYAMQTRILRDTGTPPALRAAALDQIADYRDIVELKRRLDEIRALWREVAENDPVPWVRTRAKERLEDTFE